ncbi:MAG: GNAT family N-acetyltransferase [Gemmatimonadaceae bacterium]
MIEIRSADDPEVLAIARRLISAHFAAHSTAHDSASSDAIVAALPEPYVPPRGGLWVAFVDRLGAGCVALREIDIDTGEVKRMYVDPDMRRNGIARILGKHVIDRARETGYKRLRLGTLATMKAAQSLYESLGFKSIPAYRTDEFGHTMFYELMLDGDSTS